MIRKNKKRIDPRYFLNETATREDEDHKGFRQDDADKLLDQIFSCRHGNKDLNQAIGSLAKEDFEFSADYPDANLVTYRFKFKEFGTLRWVFNTIKKACPGCIKATGFATPPTHYLWRYHAEGRTYEGSFDVPTEEERQATGATGHFVVMVRKDDFSTC